MGRLPNEVTRQREYYERTAPAYESMHVREDDAHATAARYITEFADAIDASSMLDVGCGTGRGLRRLTREKPTRWVLGVEPVRALVDQAVRTGIDRGRLCIGAGEALPFRAHSFDAACAFGIMHHVRRHDRIVAEMMRVARKAIFISDSNRFGQGPAAIRYLKLLLHAAGLWRTADYLRTRGRGYMESSGDGIYYSYSVYDSYRMLERWADRIIFMPLDSRALGRRSVGWLHPLLTSGTILLCALRDGP